MTWTTARSVLQYAIILIVLTACSPPVPLPPTASVDVVPTATVAADTNTSPLATPSVTAASTVAESPLQPPVAPSPVPTPITRLAIVDQSSVVDTSRAGWWSLQALKPIGQTFMPTFAGLDALELWTEDQENEECSSGAGERLQANLHAAALDGPLVGMSEPVVIPSCFRGMTFFGFPSLIPLTPGKVYVIEIVVISGDNLGVVWQQDPDAYPRGESIVRGLAGKTDVWFQEGLRTSTPPTEAYCQNNLWQQVKRADGSAFQSQDECMQYATIKLSLVLPHLLQSHRIAPAPPANLR